MIGYDILEFQANAGHYVVWRDINVRKTGYYNRLDLAIILNLCTHSLIFEIGYPVFQAGIELSLHLKMTLNF